MEKKPVSRRQFLRTTSGAAVAALTAARFGGAALGANDRIIMGIIGSGGRGRGLMRSCKQDKAVEFVAVCDVWEPMIQAGMKMAGPNAKPYWDHRKLLEQKGIDAVIIGSPEHLHGVHLIDSVNAGKDAYCEKPMSHSIEEGVKMVKAVRKTDRIVQIGMQRRSSPALHEAKKLIDDGLLGEVSLVRAQWFWHQGSLPKASQMQVRGKYDWERFLGSAPKRPFDPVRFRHWRMFWDYSGGIMCDQGTHLMDVVQWFMGQGTPRSAYSCGEAYQLSGYETPDTFGAVYEYPRFTATWIVTYTNRWENGWRIFFQGSKGTMWLDDFGCRVWKEPWRPDDEPIKSLGGGIPTQPHTDNFLECIRTRKEPNAPVEVGHTAVSAPHLANVAFRNKRVALLDEECSTVTLS